MLLANSNIEDKEKPQDGSVSTREGHPVTPMAGEGSSLCDKTKWICFGGLVIFVAALFIIVAEVAGITCGLGGCGWDDATKVAPATSAPVIIPTTTSHTTSSPTNHPTTPLLPTIFLPGGKTTETELESMNDLQSCISTKIGCLTSLTSLDFRTNMIYGTIPSEVGLLTQLTEIWLDSNQLLSGTIPSQLGLLTQLTLLWLCSNQLSGTIPSQLGLLTKLTALWLSDIQLLSGTIPSELGGFTKLAALSLYSTQLSGTIPSQLGLLTHLGSIDLSSNKLSGTIPSQLGLLTQLTDLWLSNNELWGTVPSSVCALADLVVNVDTQDVVCPAGCAKTCDDVDL